MIEATIHDVASAQEVLARHITPVPLLRSYPLEQHLGLTGDRRVWIKDYGWTAVGSFKLMGALNWMHHRLDEIGTRPVAAHSSGNFAAGIAFAGKQYDRKVIIVMPDVAPEVKFSRTRSLGADVRTYNKSRDHETGERDRLTREIAETQDAVQASPYDDNHVIAGNGVGGLEIVQELQRGGRQLSQFICPVSGGGLMAGHALAIADGFPTASIIGVEPSEADDFQRSLKSGKRESLQHPQSICDGLLSYDVGEHNWPILKRLVSQTHAIPDRQTQVAMKWMYQHHGLRIEPSGAISVAALLDRGQYPELQNCIDRDQGDIVVVVSGRNVDVPAFDEWIASV